MTKEALILGVTGVALGVGILIKTGSIIPALIPTIIGIALIILRKEENKIEERKDIREFKNSRVSQATIKKNMKK